MLYISSAVYVTQASELDSFLLSVIEAMGNTCHGAH